MDRRMQARAARPEIAAAGGEQQAAGGEQPEEDWGREGRSTN